MFLIICVAILLLFSAGFSLPGCQVPASGGDIKCPRFEESERKLSADDELFRELYEILEKSLQYT